MALPQNIFDRILDPTNHGTGATPESNLWNRLLFYPGRPVQSAELNELVTILMRSDERLARTLFAEGSRISGIEIIQKPNLKIQITSGQMFIDGKVRDITGTPVVPIAQDLQPTGNGREFVGILRTEVIKRPENDTTLLNPVIAPTVGATQYNQKGALRQIYQYTWVVVNDDNPNPSAIPIFEFRDGNLITTQSEGQFTELLRVLARRTYDESGHYLVNGFVVNVAQSADDVDKMLVRIDSGKAYVAGYEILKTAPSIFSIEKAVTTNAVNNESFLFTATPTPTFLYKLASRPVKRVEVVAAKVYRSWTQNNNGIRVTRSTTDDFDDLFSTTNVSPDISPDGSQQGIAIYQLLKISNQQGSPSTPAPVHYTQGTDYSLDGNTIRWLTGNRPGPGQAYYVDLILIRNLKKGRRRRVVVVNEEVTHGSSQGIDNLLNKDIIRVTRVANTTNLNDAAYVENRDYKVVTGRQSTTLLVGALDWSLTGVGTAEPSASALYYVSYEYWEHLPGAEGDYVSRDSYYDTDNTTSAAQYLEQYKYTPLDTDTENSIDFRCVGADLPVHGLSITVDYEFFVPRRDTIGLDSNGAFIIHKGIPSRNPIYPVVDVSNLEIAKLDIPPNSIEVLISYPETRRLTFRDLWQMRDNLDIQVYNSLIRYLESMAFGEFTPSVKKMILVDPFIDFSRTDFLYSRSGVKFHASIDPENGKMMLPQLYGTRVLETFNTQHCTANFTKLVMAEYTSSDLLVQTFATEKVALNPFTIIDPVVSITISPNEWALPDVVATPAYRPDARTDSLMPLTVSDLRVGSDRVTRVFGFVQKALNRFWVGGTRIVQWGGTSQLNQIVNIFSPTNTSVDHPSDSIVESRAMDRIDTKLLDRSSVPIMDQIEITVSSDNWYPFTDNIKIYFDGVQVEATGTSNAYVGTLVGTLRADQNGVFIGKITIPSASPTGRREIRASSLVPGQTDRFLNASAILAVEGARQIHNTSFVSLQVVDNSESNPTNVVNAPRRTQPIAQTFRSRRNVWITGLDLYFGRRPNPGSSADRPLIVQIRDVDQDGEPGTNVLAQKSLRATNVNVSLDSSEVTTIVLDNPVFIQDDSEYAVVLATEAGEYSVFLSRLGSNDILTNQLVVKNADTGKLWRSEGGLSWVQDQYAELKFRVRCAQFDPTTRSIVVFKNITNISSSQVLRNSKNEVNIPSDPTNANLLPNKYKKFLHVVSYFAPSGSRMLWYYSTNGGENWTSYTPGVEVDMVNVPTELQIKCEMDMQQITGIDGSKISVASGAINLDHNALILLANEATGTWVSKNVNIPQVSNNLRMVFLTNVQKNPVAGQASLTSYYSVDGGFSWSPLNPPIEKVLSEPLREWRYDQALPPFSQICIRIDLANSTDFSAEPSVRLMRLIAY